MDKEEKSLMNKKRNIIAAVIVIVLLLGAIGAVSLINPSKEKPNEQGVKDTYTVINEDIDNIAAMKVLSNDFSISVSNKDGEWTIDSSEKEDIDSAKVESLVGSVSTIISKNEYAAENLLEYGLETPAITVDLTKKNGEKIKINIGDLSPILGEYFVMLEGGDKVYTLYSYKVDTLLKPLSFYRDFDRLSLNVDDIREIKTEGDNSYHIKIKDKIGENFSSVWEMTSPYVSGANDDYIDNKILSSIESLSLTTPVEDNNYFDSDNVKVTLTIQPYDNATGKYADSYIEELTVGKTIGDKGYVRYKDKVFEVRADSVSFAKEVPFNIVSKLQALVDIALVKSVTVEYDGQSTTLDISKGKDGNYDFKLDGKNTDPSASQEIYRRIIALNVDDVYKGENKGDMVLRLTYAGIKSEDDTVIEFNKINDLSCALTRNGETTFTIKTSKLDEFKTVFNAFKDSIK